MGESLIPLVSIVGPTASGKTELAVNLAKAFNGEIVSADSMQIYKEFTVSTAKPSAHQINSVKHYMVDILPVTEEFSVAKFASLAHKHIADIYSRGFLPILAGGTGLYIDSVINNTEFETVSKVSDSVCASLSNFSNEELASMLKKIDPESAKKIHVNDTKRLKRAVEFFYTSGYPISDQVKNSKKSFRIYKTCKIGLAFRNREILYEKINSRVDEMFKNGIIDEAKNLMQLKLSKTARAAIGYKEILPFLSGECTFDEAKNNLKQATRRYAKRQLTWFKRDEEINWIFCDEYESFSQVFIDAQKIVLEFLKFNKKDN